MKGMDWSVAAEGEELAAGGAVDVQCSRVAVVGDDAEVEDPAARDEDDAQYNRCLASLPNLQTIDREVQAARQCPRPG
jgi:hypothetical protein